jgi:surfeit locus 1 family protein
MMASKHTRFISIALLTLIIAATFIELGVWQLHRAQEVQHLNQPKPEQPLIDLNTIAKPSENLVGDAINRLVRFTGHYLVPYLAPNQSYVPINTSDSRSKVVGTLNVGLFKVDPPSSSAAILVVRGTGNQTLPQGEISISGRLYPHQSTDHANSSTNILSRIDPALVAGVKDVVLFDGYVIVTSEKDATGKVIPTTRISAPAIKVGVPGFYWQHLSYVFIWWSMAVLVLYAPIWSRRTRAKS